MTHKEIACVIHILQNHTNKVFLYDIGQEYSIKIPRGTASIFSKNVIFTCILLHLDIHIYLDTCEAM